MQKLWELRFALLRQRIRRRSKMGFGFGFSDFSTGFNIMGVFVTLMFVVVFGLFIVVAVKGISQWNKNNHSPRLTVPATIVAKRTNVSHHHGANHGVHHSTSYYVTFQVESGDRMELHMAGHQYGLLVEGDRGKLTFQGTRFLSFERT